MPRNDAFSEVGTKTQKTHFSEIRTKHQKSVIASEAKQSKSKNCLNHDFNKINKIFPTRLKATQGKALRKNNQISMNIYRISMNIQTGQPQGIAPTKQTTEYL